MWVYTSIILTDKVGIRTHFDILVKETWGLPWQGAQCRGQRDTSGEVREQPLRDISNEERMGCLSKLLRM